MPVMGVRYSGSRHAETSGVEVCSEKQRWREKLSIRICCILDVIAAIGSVLDSVSAHMDRVLDVWESSCEALLSVCLSSRLFGHFRYFFLDAIYLIKTDSYQAVLGK